MQQNIPLVQRITYSVTLISHNVLSIWIPVGYQQYSIDTKAKDDISLVLYYFKPFKQMKY